MFKTKEKAKTEKSSLLPQNTSNEGTTCVISSGTKMEGKFSASENVRLDGTIIGEVDCTKRIVMGSSGRIEGTVVSQDLIVKGTIKGDVTVRGLLHLQQSAYIEGKISAKSMIVDEGASYNGECKVGQKATPTLKAKVA